MLQTRNSRWTAATVLVCVLILVAAWFLLVDPRRADAADLREQRAQAAQQNDALQLQIAQLKAQFADLPARQAELAAIRTQLPSKADLPALIRNLDELAKKAGVTLTSITPQPATPVAVSAAAAAGASAGGASAGGTSAGGAASGARAAATGSSLFAVPTTIAVSGDYFASAQFLRLVQTEMPRAFLVTNLTVERSTQTPDSDGAVNLTVAGQIYVLLDSAASAQVAVGAVQGAVQGTTGATGGTGATGSATPTSPSPTAGTSPSPAATPTPTTSAPTN